MFRVIDPPFRSPRERVGGLYHFGRRVHKIRCHLREKLPEEYRPNFGLSIGLDGMLCGMLGVTHAGDSSFKQTNRTIEEMFVEIPGDEPDFFRRFAMRAAWSSTTIPLISLNWRNPDVCRFSNTHRHLYRRREPGRYGSVGSALCQRCGRAGRRPNDRRVADDQAVEAETWKKYQHTIEPLASAEKDGKTIITNRLTGNFPGSPIELEFVFTLDGDKIASLEILS